MSMKKFPTSGVMSKERQLTPARKDAPDDADARMAKKGWTRDSPKLEAAVQVMLKSAGLPLDSTVTIDPPGASGPAKGRPCPACSGKGVC